MLHGQLAQVPTPSIETDARSEPRPWEQPPETQGRKARTPQNQLVQYYVSAKILSKCVTLRSLLLGGKLHCSRSSVPQHEKEKMAVWARVAGENGWMN